MYQHEIDHLDGILYIDRIRDKDKLFSNLGYCNAMAERAMDALFPPGGRGDT